MVVHGSGEKTPAYSGRMSTNTFVLIAPGLVHTVHATDTDTDVSPDLVNECDTLMNLGAHHESNE